MEEAARMDKESDKTMEEKRKEAAEKVFFPMGKESDKTMDEKRKEAAEKVEIV